MAAAYAALISLTHVIEQIMVHDHARQPIFRHKQQRRIVSLQEEVSFLQDFLEVYFNGASNEAQGLASRIADIAYAAEAVFETHVVDTLLSQNLKRRSKTNIMFDGMRSFFSFNGKNNSNHFSQGLQKVMRSIDCIRKEVMEVKENRRVEDQQRRDLVPVVSSRPSNTEKDTMLEYYDEDLEQIMDKLTGQSSNLQLIPIVGMGGIGKTTLARTVYKNPLTVECFYIRAWITISQEYNLREVLCGLLHEIGVSYVKEEQDSEYHQLGEKLHKHLAGRKYLIVMDDIWSIDVWEKLKLFLPDYDNGSRVIITTRSLDVVDSSGSLHLYRMKLLDEKKSWSLLCRKVFGNDGNCPLEQEGIGKDIAKRCKGLPLSIVVIGGLLAKSEMTRRYWENVSKDINRIVNSEDNGHWLKILSLSYENLPIHLKPCFLYMGILPEDYDIRVSKLIKLWVAEGILKPNKAKSLEEVAEDYLKELIERNLIFVRKWGSIGKMKTCGIHDLLRDLCLKEAEKERYFCVIKPGKQAQSINNERRIVFHERWSSKIDSHQFDAALHSKPFIRSLLCTYFQWNPSWALVRNLRLLRVVTNTSTLKLENNNLQLVNLRYLKCDIHSDYLKYDAHMGASVVLSPFWRLWFLQILILTGVTHRTDVPNEIWEMPQLRHIISRNGIYLPDPLGGRKDKQGKTTVLKNLQTLSWIKDIVCTEEVLKRIPNVKKLSIYLEPRMSTTGMTYFYLHNFGRLHKLQSLNCQNFQSLQQIVFPQSLKKLTLCFCRFDWDDITEKVGSLPYLEKLKLDDCEAGAEWNTVEGKFLCLRLLEMAFCHHLVSWTADGTHFPVLECLVLQEMTGLKEIPSGLGDTLQSIELVFCGSSVIASAKEILEEQQSFGNEGLRVSCIEA